MMYRQIVDYIIAYDLQFNEFERLYETRWKYKPDKEIINKAIKYFETGE